ncbi:succinate dehydrogenase assembly factor 2 [Oceanospirillum beijerinckii]|uniref:FAD assembly factor SdhE n=1 Tax=Oceanospirillum beijerinckii TaxID=64976 RepID=UPI000411AC68|nr:succinate dehydrogenase assembly factor 2 [Oceanospirillum beijerinckii]MAC45594.1 succinate dehydrogenase assembly factor 2 [Oceanospirillum sp.]
MSVEEEVKRLQWQSRRGMWELDLMLVPFVRDCYRELSEHDRIRYEELLKCEDQDLFVWLMQREVPAESEHKDMVEKIIAYAEDGDLSKFRHL